MIEHLDRELFGENGLHASDMEQSLETDVLRDKPNYFAIGANDAKHGRIQSQDYYLHHSDKLKMIFYAVNGQDYNPVINRKRHKIGDASGLIAQDVITEVRRCFFRQEMPHTAKEMARWSSSYAMSNRVYDNHIVMMRTRSSKTSITFGLTSEIENRMWPARQQIILRSSCKQLGPRQRNNPVLHQEPCQERSTSIFVDCLTGIK